MTEKLNMSKDSTYQFEHFFEISPDLMCIAGFDGYFKWINPAVTEVLGYTKAELFSRPIDTFIHEDDRDITMHKRDELRANNPLLNFENRYVTKSGEIVWLHWTSMPVPDEKIIYAVAKNITHKKKIEEIRNHQLSNLTKSNHEIRQLTYTTAHDLRSPVNNLLSFLSLLDLEAIDDKETLELLSMVQSLGKNLKQTLDNSIDVLIASDNLKAVTEELSLSKVLQNVINSVNSLIKTSGTSITIDFSELERINFNRAFLESIFLNLITNSIKYARPGILPVIKIYSKKENGLCQLIVSDNGLGFDTEKVKDKVFGFQQKFHEHDDSKGIGLYLVYNHITSMGGQIVLESEPGKGSKFIISFKN